jgi:hypothetical protein
MPKSKQILKNKIPILKLQSSLHPWELQEYQNAEVFNHVLNEVKDLPALLSVPVIILETRKPKYFPKIVIAGYF